MFEGENKSKIILFLDLHSPRFKEKDTCSEKVTKINKETS